MWEHIIRLCMLPVQLDARAPRPFCRRHPPTCFALASQSEVTGVTPNRLQASNLSPARTRESEKGSTEGDDVAGSVVRVGEDDGTGG